MNKKLFVKNLSFKLTEAELTDVFASCGEVVSTFIAKDRQTGRPRGFGFVEMGSSEEARQAIESLNNTDVGGRPISISIAEDRPRKPGSGSGSGSGSGYRSHSRSRN